MKKLLLFLFGVLMAFPSFAHEFKYTYKGQTLTYTVLDENAKTCEIKYSSSVNEVSGTLIIPSLAMDGNIAYSVTEIGVRAFCDCSNLTSVAIPNSVTTICESAFCRCSSLKSVSIPNSVTLIDNYAFYDCTGLTRAEFASVESLCQIEFKNFCSNPLYYSQKLYLGGKEIRGLYIPNTVTSIGNYAIYGGAGLSWVFISNSVTSIGAYAFCGCTGLTSISIPNSVTYIGDAAFFMCTGLKRAEFSSLESLLKIRFVGSYSNPLRNAHSLYIDGKEITEVVIPETVTTIGNYSFEGFTNLKSVTIPGSVTSIGIGAFSKCSSLKSVTIPNSVTTIDRYSFSCCTGLESVIIPGSVTTIDSNAFEYCTALKSVTIPGSVTSLGGSVFENCSGLTKVNVNWDKPVNIHYSMFEPEIYDTAIFNVPANAIAAYLPTEWWKLFKNREAGGYPVKDYKNDTLNYTLISNPDSPSAILVNGDYSSMTTVNIPESFTVRSDGANPVRYDVTAIGPYAFKDCMNLKEVNFSQSSFISSIGSSAFENCTGLKSITIPKAVTTLCERAFYGCTELQSVNLNDGLDIVGNSSFFGCTKLATIKIPGTVKTLGNSAFRNCSSLESVNIPNSVTSIRDNAFFNCYKLDKSEFASIESLCRIDFESVTSNPLTYTHNLYVAEKKSRIWSYLKP